MDKNKNNKGFTLIEVLLTTAIVIIILAFSVFLGLDSFKGYNFNDERAGLIGALQKARSQAINNICLGTCTDGKPHGVAIRPSDHPESYVIFQTETGKTYSQRSSDDKDQDIIISANENIAFTGINEVVYVQLSGNTDNTGDINMTDTTNHSSVITLNKQGQITWTN